MPRRRDDDYDDWDDYQPRGRRDRDPGGGGPPAAVWVGLGVGAIVVVAVIAIFVMRGRNDPRAMAAERAQADQAATAARAAAEAASRSRGAPAWPRLIGTWERPTRGKTDTGYHFRFEFRADMTGTMTRLDSDGNPLRQDVTVEILSDGDDTARLRLLVPRGLYGYTFTLKPDGTMVLDDRKGGLVFWRAE